MKPTARQLNRLFYVSFILGLCVTAFLLPFDRWAGHIGPVSMLSASLLLLFPWGVTEAFRTSRSRKNSIYFGLSIMAILLAVVLSLSHAISSSYAISGIMILVFLLVRSWLIGSATDKRGLALFESVLLAISLLVVGFGYFQFIADLLGFPQAVTHLLPRYSSQSTFIIPRVQSTALEPLYLANFLFIPLGILIARFIKVGHINKWWEIAFFVATLFLFISTVSRGAILGLIVAFIIMAFGLLHRFSIVKKLALPAVGVVTIAVLIMAAIAFQYTQQNAVKETVGIPRSAQQAITHLIDFNDRSANTRYELWPKAIDAVKTSPLTGVGFYSSRIFIHQEQYRAETPVAELQPLNNDYLGWLADTGLIGVILSLPLIVLVVQKSWQIIRGRCQSLATPYLFALTGMAVQAATFHSMLLLRLWVVLGVFFAADRLYNSTNQQPNETSSLPQDRKNNSTI